MIFSGYLRRLDDLGQIQPFQRELHWGCDLRRPRETLQVDDQHRRHLGITHHIQFTGNDAADQGYLWSGLRGPRVTYVQMQLIWCHPKKKKNARENAPQSSADHSVEHACGRTAP